MCLDTHEEHSSDTALEYTSRPQRSAFDALLAETVTTTRQTTTTQSTHMDKGLSGATEIKQVCIHILIIELINSYLTNVICIIINIYLNYILNN